MTIDVLKGHMSWSWKGHIRQAFLGDWMKGVSLVIPSLSSYLSKGDVQQEKERFTQPFP